MVIESGKNGKTQGVLQYNQPKFEMKVTVFIALEKIATLRDFQPSGTDGPTLINAQTGTISTNTSLKATMAKVNNLSTQRLKNYQESIYLTTKMINAATLFGLILQQIS